MIGIALLGIIILLTISITIFLNVSPQFGKGATDIQKEKYAKSMNFKEGKFNNLGDIKRDTLTFSEYIDLTIKFFGKQPNTIPSGTIPVEKIDSLSIVNYENNPPRIIWFGHSTLLIQLEGKNILIDPMFGNVPAPADFLGQPRFNKELPITIEKLPQIDIVILSHDHYDHLDYGSIVKLKTKVKQFYTPLGVGNHLTEWGIDQSIINELDWWQDDEIDQLKLICTPSQHFSGRGLNDGNCTLWSSWVIKTKQHSIYFSGDSGYGPHFKKIGDKYGPFDFAMMECGQYNEKWSKIHMMPNETIQASLDVQAKTMMPIHWGTFKLALHTWDDPIEQATMFAKELNVNIATPKIGEVITLDSTSVYPHSNWWRKVQ